MNKKDFIEENEDVLKTLAERVELIRDIRGIAGNIEREVLGRQYAIEIMDGWLKELFNITTKDISPLYEEEDLDIIRTKE